MVSRATTPKRRGRPAREDVRGEVLGAAEELLRSIGLEAITVADNEGNKARSADLALIKEFSLKPRNIIPRNLRSGIYRGGRRPIDLYYRIMAGINGSGMPAHNTLLKTEEDRWAIVAYVLNLPYQAGGALAFEQEQLAPSRETN